MRVKTLVAPAAVTLLALGGLATTATAEPGPHGPNNYGLCTAYFAGSETGQENKRKAPPFAALEEAAEASGTEEEMEAAVTEWCDSNGTHPGQGGGKGGKQSE